MSSNSFLRTIHFLTITRLRRSKAVNVDVYQQPTFGEKEWEGTKGDPSRGGGCRLR